MPRIDPSAIPPEARQLAAELAGRPGVTGCFWGSRRRRGVWQSENVLSVHVRRKSSRADGQIPESRYGISTDVIAVGSVSLHAMIDTADFVRATSASDRRRSAVSALGLDGDRIVALLSGHGTLRTAGSGFQSGPWPADDAPWVKVVDEDSTARLAELVDGVVAPDLDFALAELPNLDPDEVLLGHTLASSPIVARSASMVQNERLVHFSPMRGRSMAGRYVQTQLLTAEGGLTATDGESEVVLRDVLVVRPIAGEPAFSVAGDSGSLVFDADRRAVGVVVAGTEAGDLSYVLPLNQTFEDRLGKNFQCFFENES